MSLKTLKPFPNLPFRRRLHVELLWNVTLELNVLHPDNWMTLAEAIMGNITRHIYVATKAKGWDGNPDDDDEERDQLWSFPGALLYSITVITTIGQHRGVEVI